jgi:hypothetical protein
MTVATVDVGQVCNLPLWAYSKLQTCPTAALNLANNREIRISARLSDLPIMKECVKFEQSL